RYVLLDVGLPGLDGYQVASRLRQELAESIVLIAITGYGRAEDRHWALASGFDYHFVKPLDQDALNTLLDTLGAGPSSRQSASLAQPAPLPNAVVADSASFQGASGGCPSSSSPPQAEPPPQAMSRAEDPARRLSRQVEVNNIHGLHLRAANQFARLALQ